jgi:hypothetical protein
MTRSGSCSDPRHRPSLLGVPGFLPGGLPLGLLVLSPLEWQALVLVPVIGVAAGFVGLRLAADLLPGLGAAVDHVIQQPDMDGGVIVPGFAAMRASAPARSSFARPGKNSSRNDGASPNVCAAAAGSP